MSDCTYCGDICMCGSKGDPRSRLASLMSELSEECYCAGWLIDTEHVLWDLAHQGGGKWGIDEVTPDHAARLLALSAEVGGWIAWKKDGDPVPYGPLFVPLAEWLKRHEESDYMRWKREREPIP